MHDYDWCPAFTIIVRISNKAFWSLSQLQALVLAFYKHNCLYLQCTLEMQLHHIPFCASCTDQSLFSQHVLLRFCDMKKFLCILYIFVVGWQSCETSILDRSVLYNEKATTNDALSLTSPMIALKCHAWLLMLMHDHRFNDFNVYIRIGAIRTCNEPER